MAVILIFAIGGSAISSFAEPVESPLKQSKHVSDIHDIKCKTGLTLIFKASIWTPACVKPSSVEKLVARGWASPHDLRHMGESIMSQSVNPSESLSISQKELEQKMNSDPDVVIIDMRDSNSYMNGHIEGSSVDVMEGATLEKRINTMFGRVPEVAERMHVVLVGDSETKTRDSAQIMNDAGIKTSYLLGGLDSWENSLSAKPTPALTTSEELYQRLQNQEDVYLLDVREPAELEKTMISASTNIPLSDIFIEGNLSEIPTDKPVVVICSSGNRATIATYELAKHGIDFQVLDGGIQAWDKYLEENSLPKQ